MNNIVVLRSLLRFGLAALFLLACLFAWPMTLCAAEAEAPAQATNSPTPSSATAAPAATAGVNDSAAPAPAPAASPATVVTNGASNHAAELRAAQEAIEQLRREIESSATRNAEAISAGLGLIEPTLARMHERQMEAVQSSNRTILIVAGVFAAVGFVGLIFISLILVRAIGRFSDMAVVGAP